MSKMVEAKIAITNTGMRFFTKSNYYWIAMQENVSEVVDGVFSVSRKTFIASDGRKFLIRKDFSAALAD